MSAQDGLTPIVQRSGVSDVHPLRGVGAADAAIEFRQKVDSITENVVCVAKRPVRAPSSWASWMRTTTATNP